MQDPNNTTQQKALFQLKPWLHFSFLPYEEETTKLWSQFGFVSRTLATCPRTEPAHAKEEEGNARDASRSQRPRRMATTRADATGNPPNRTGFSGAARLRVRGKKKLAATSLTPPGPTPHGQATPHHGAVRHMPLPFVYLYLSTSTR